LSADAQIPKLSCQQLQLFILSLQYRVRTPAVCMVAGTIDLILAICLTLRWDRWSHFKINFL